MKRKFLSFITICTGILLSAQTPVITGIIDGDCDGGNPKVVEIYAQGTVDFSEYILQKSANGASFGNNLSLSDLGEVTDEYVYLYRTDDIFAQQFPNVSNTFGSNTQAVNFNGDDAIRLIDSNENVIDVYGEEADGTGTVWEYKDGYAFRNPGAGPSATFDASEWTIENGILDGTCSTEPGSLISDIAPIASYATTTEVCEAPSEVNVEVIDNNNVTFSDVDGQAGDIYDVVSNANPGFDPMSIEPQFMGIEMPFQVPFNLASDWTYEFYARKVCGEETSDWAGPFQFTTEPGTRVITVTVSPNPARDVVTVGGANIAEVVVYDMFGKVVLQTKVDNNQFNVQGLMPGHYTVQMINESGEVITKRIIKK